MTEEILGYIGGSLIVISLIPQLIKIITLKTSAGVSLEMFIVLLIAQGMWIGYSVLKNDFVILICNVASAFITVLILIFGYNYRETAQTEKKIILENENEV